VRPKLYLFKHQAVSNTGHYYWQHTIVFRSTSKHANADAMSWLPLPEKPASTPVPVELALMIEKLDGAPITSVQIANWTKKDPDLRSSSFTVYTAGMAK